MRSLILLTGTYLSSLWCRVPATTASSPTPWVVTYGSGLHGVQRHALSLDEEDGSIYVGGGVTGNMFSVSNTGYTRSYPQAFAARIHPKDGSLMWGYQVDPGSGRGDKTYAMVSKGDFVYIAGVTSGTMFYDQREEFGKQEQIFVICLSRDTGNKVWSKQISSYDDDSPMDIIADNSGIYITGWTFGSLYGVNAGQVDAFLVKMGFDGRFIWGSQWGGAYYDQASYVEFESPLVVRIGGYSNSASSEKDWQDDDSMGENFCARYDTSTGQHLSDCFVKPPEHEFGTIVTLNGVYSTDVHESSLYVTKNPCKSGTHLDLVKRYGVGTAQCAGCLPSTYSEDDFSTRCSWCREGYSSGVGDSSCVERPGGYHRKYGTRSACQQCSGFTWAYPGSEHCRYFSWKYAMYDMNASAFYIVIYICAALAFAIAAVLGILDLDRDVNAVIMLSTLNVLSDVIYVSTSVFATAQWMWMCLLFTVLPISHFTYFILRLCSPEKKLTFRLLFASPMVQARLWRLSVVDGLPRWDNMPYYIPPAVSESPSTATATTTTEWNMNTRIRGICAWAEAGVKQLLFCLAWIAFHIIYFSPFYLVHFMFYTSAVFAGYFLYLSKLLHVKKVEAFWLEWLFGTGEMVDIWVIAGRESNSVSRIDMNASIFAEAILEAIPLFIWQTINSSALKHNWTAIFVISLVLSVLVLLVLFMRIVYWHVWRRMPLLNIPIWYTCDADSYVELGVHKTDGSINSGGEETNVDAENGDTEQYKPYTSSSNIDDGNTLIRTNKLLELEQNELRRQLRALEGRLLQHESAMDMSSNTADGDLGSVDNPADEPTITITPPPPTTITTTTTNAPADKEYELKELEI